VDRHAVLARLNVVQFAMDETTHLEEKLILIVKNFIDMYLQSFIMYTIMVDIFSQVFEIHNRQTGVPSDGFCQISQNDRIWAIRLQICYS
jgi:hypothetical protein